MGTVTVTLVPAMPADVGTLEHLLHLYVHDFSEFIGLLPSDDGRYSYPALPLYWLEPGRSAYLLRTGNGLVGFALISRGSQVSGDPTIVDVAEFFVVRGARLCGVGRGAAIQLFDSIRGVWEVRVREVNTIALRFWQSVILRYTSGNFESREWSRNDGSRWTVFRFDNNFGNAGA